MKTYVQQIMLGSVTSNEKNASMTLKRIKDAGYDGIELNSFMIHPTSMMVRAMTKAAGMPTGKGGRLDWHRLIEDAGLEVASVHTDLGSLERDVISVAKEVKSFDTNTAVITGMYRFDYTDEREVNNLAKRLNEVGKCLRDEGVRLLYHNHNVELLNVTKENRAYDILIDMTDKEYVNFEFDSFWFTDGGADAKEWMRRLGTRMKLWHVTDRGSRQIGQSMTPILKCDSLELGSGNMDLEGLKAIALDNGVDKVVLESHKNWIDNDPVKSIEISGKYLSGWKEM
ncbi:MAG: sugar phosphate isomerase/epimerase [Lachnospiraceae bacterium]|nr:sugar phosphate isomerase/epimerase [Lachnospiraceae bacterium]